MIKYLSHSGGKVEAALTFLLLTLAGKRTAPSLTGAGEDNCSDFTTALTVAALSFSYLAVAMIELELTFVDQFLSPALFSFSAILFGL